MSTPIQRVRVGLVGFGLVVLIGTAGYVVRGWTLLESMYMVVITISGVGYKEVRPEMTPGDRIWTMLVIIFGLTSAAYFVGGVIQLMAEGEINRAFGRRRLSRQIEGLSDHIIICGFGRMGLLVCEDLARAKIPFLLIDRDPDRTTEADRDGYLYLLGDATEEETLVTAGITRARGIVTVLPSDADNVFITLTARGLNEKIQIIARAELPSSQNKLLQAGADRVVLPAAIGAQAITALLTQPAALELMELVTGRQRVDLQINEFSIPEQSPLNGSTLAEAEVRNRTGVIVVAIKRPDDTVVFNPESDLPLRDSDLMVVMGRRDNIDRFREEYKVS